MTIKIGIMNDTHIRESNPVSRTDDYIVALMKKYMETSMLIDQYKLDLIVHTGDMFDGPRIDNEISGLFAEIMKSYNCPMVVVPGNHDIFGYSMSNINRTTLGLLAKAGVFELLTRSNPTTISKDGLTVSIQGQEFTPDVDKNPDRYLVDVDPIADYHVLAVHGAVLDKSGPPNMDYVLVDDIPASPTQCPVIICAGHYHPGFKTKQSKNNPFVINHGSAGRDSASADVKTRMPGLNILEFDNQGWRENFVEFKSAQPASAVFDFNINAQKKAKKNYLANFRQNMANTSNFKPFDVMKILNEKATKAGNLKECLKAISDAEALHASVTQKIQGYKDCGYSKRIVSIEAENFMSHGRTVVQLDPQTNMFVGASNNGKSALIPRLIRWVCFDSPKGTDYIKLGKSKVRGKITYDDGTWIERERSRSSAGYLRVFDGNQVHEFTKFSRSLPIELFNVHQMPDIILSKDKSINLSVSEQLDAPFLLSESPATRAAIVGTLAGLDGFDTAIRENAKAAGGIQKSIREKEKMITELNQKLEGFTDLPKLENQIAAAQLGVDVIDNLTKRIDEINNFASDLEALNKQISIVQTELDVVKQIDTNHLLLILGVADNADVEVQWLTEAVTTYDQLTNDIANWQAGLNALPKTEGLLEIIDQALPLEEGIKELNDYIYMAGSLQSQVDQVQYDLDRVPRTDNLLKHLAVAEELDVQIKEITDYEKDLDDLEIKMLKVDNKRLDAVARFRVAKGDYRLALKEAKVCPECFSTLDDMLIAKILDNVTGGTNA